MNYSLHALCMSFIVPSKLVYMAYINSVPPTVRHNKPRNRKEPREDRKEPRDRKERKLPSMRTNQHNWQLICLISATLKCHITQRRP